MKTSNPNVRNQQSPNVELFSQFSESRLTYNEMFAVRGGGDGDDDQGGSQSDIQDDGFN